MIEPPLGMVDLIDGICCASTEDCFGIWVVWRRRGIAPLFYCWFIRFYKDNLGQVWYPLVNVYNRLHKYGNSTCLMCKSTMSMAIFNSKLLNYRRVKHKIWVSQSKAQRKRLPVIQNSQSWFKGNTLFPAHSDLNLEILLRTPKWILLVTVNYTVPTFKYVEAGPDRQAQEVV